jgi:CDP-diacylglycerol--glycerol-3-phosphate 3-phosphatidyltransferase
MAVRTVSAPLAQLPNALTVGRLLVVPVFAGLLLTADGARCGAAAILFGVAAITDQVDGYLARRWHVESAFGKIADPLADRLLIDIAVLILWHDNRLPWVALVIPARDLVLILATPFALGRGYKFEVNFLGKVATWGLYLSLAMVMSTHEGARWPLWLFWTGFGLAVVSLAAYARKARKELR